MNRFVKILSILALALIAVWLRFWQLASLPAVVHRDEASIGYNAYAIAQTGRDEHGVEYPVNFKAFGEYKLPGLIYLTVPFVKFLGLNAWAVRLPTALAAILCLPALFWLVREMGFSKKVGWISLLLLTFSFWHVTQARNAYEPMVGLLLSLVALSSWLRGMKRPKWLLLSIVSYGISCWFYNVPWLLLPLVFGIWSLIEWLHHKSRLRSKLLALLGIGIVMVSVGWLLSGVNASRNGTTVFSNPELVTASQTLIHAGLVGGLPSIISRVAQYKLVLAVVKIGQGYVASFSPTYLFFTGDGNAWHNLQSIQLGNMNPVLLIWISLGLWLVISQVKQKSHQLLLSYVLLSPLLSAVTVDAPITNRLLDFHISLTLLAAVGLGWLLDRAKQNQWAKRVLVVTAFVYIGFVALFVERYYFIFNQVLHPFWNPGVRTLVQEVQVRQSEYDQIYITSDLELGYIFFAFYTPFEPTQFAAEAERYTSGFDQVARFQKYSFAKFPTEWRNFSLETINNVFYDEVDKVLIVDRGRQAEQTKKDLEITDWWGNVEWTFWSVSVDQVLAQLKALPVAEERKVEIEYLESCQVGWCDEGLLPMTEENTY